MPALDLPVRLGIVRRSPDMRHARDTNELLEVTSNELRSIVGDDLRLRFDKLLLGSLQNHFDIRLLHRLPEIPTHDIATVPIQYATQVVEGATHIDVGDIDVPVLMRL